MKKIVIILLLSASILSQANAASKPDGITSKDSLWTFEGQSSINLTQGFLENWTPGGENFLSGLLLNDYTLSYEKNNSSWENNFTYKFGLTQQGEQKLRKTEDIFELNSKYGYDLNTKNLFFSNIVNFKTQFFEGYDYANDNDSIAISNFLNPGYLTLATGIEYKYKKILSVMVSPLAGKVTFMTDTTNYDPVAFGIEKGDKSKIEMGAYARVKFKKELLKNVSVDSYLELFSNYMENPQNVDVNWQTTFTFNVNKYIKTVLFFHLVYDDDVPIPKTNGGTTKAIQFKETLGIGISYAIGK